MTASARADQLTSPGGEPVPQASVDYCTRLTRRHAANFYYGMKLLPEPKRSAMYALYAYLRLLDDIADSTEGGRSVGQRIADLETWRGLTHDALAGRPLKDDRHNHLWPAFAAMAHQYHVPAHLFDDAIAGQLQDLQFTGFDTFDELRDYCYRVAGVVGLASCHIWGFSGGADTEALAIDRGTAFQLTNILRDLREDAGKSRLYLPRQELAVAGITESELTGGPSERLVPFLRRQIDRAESYYMNSAALESRVEADSRPTLIAMTEIYHGLLAKMAADPLRVLRHRVSLSLITKLCIGWKATRANVVR